MTLPPPPPQRSASLFRITHICRKICLLTDPRIDTTSDSHTGGEFYVPSEGTTDEERFNNRVRSSSQPSTKRHNLSLNIGALPAPYQYHGYNGSANGASGSGANGNASLSTTSPTTLASSGAPFTDSFAGYDFGQDYFQFSDNSAYAPPSSAAPSDIQCSNDQQQQEAFPTSAFQFGYRLPASQPSSPVRSGYPPGQAPYIPQPGRQRSTTFSGGYQYTDTFGGPLPVPPPTSQPSAVPAHLSFTQFRSPVESPLSGSPVVSTSNGFLTEPLNPDTLMEDVATPLAGQPLHSLPSQIASLATNLPASIADQQLPQELARSLVLINQEVEKVALAMRQGQDPSNATANLIQLTNQLASATGGTPPIPPQQVTPQRDQTPSSQGVSPVALQTSPAMPMATGAASGPVPPRTPVRAPPTATVPVSIGSMAPPPQQQHLQPSPIQPGSMQPSPIAASPASQQPPPHQPGLLPSLPVVDNMKRAPPPLDMSQVNTTLQVPAPDYMSQPHVQQHQSPLQPMPSPQQLQQQSQQEIPPPLIHSHSFPNGHQLPSQIHAPVTPVSASPSFVNSIGASHAPVISSPLATMPVSRPPSPPRAYPPVIPDEMHAPPLAVVHSDTDLIDTTTRPDGRPVINRTRSASVNRQKGLTGMTASMPPSAWQSRANSPVDDEYDSEDDAARRPKRRRSSTDVHDVTLNATEISPDVKIYLDEIFRDFLNKVCSDLDYADSKGDKLHQVLMPKKMARLDESPDYRPFKFRIQSFTNAFQEELSRRGITEETISAKKVKLYLWKQDLISRFNQDGKKSKSKGNHIWNVDAKKLPDGSWVFRPFQRRIMINPAPFATVGHRYEYEPKIWDPQAASETIKATFSSPRLPPWLTWSEGTTLTGIPDGPTAPFPVTVVADFLDAEGQHCTLDMVYTLQAVSPMQPAEPYPQPPMGWMPAAGYSGMATMPSLPMPGQMPQLGQHQAMMYGMPPVPMSNPMLHSGYGQQLPPNPYPQ